MNDRPSAVELIDAVRLFLDRELLPALTDQRLRFQTLVAANVLGIASRELIGEEELLRQEWLLLRDVVAEAAPMPVGRTRARQAVHDMNETLCQRIRNGDFDEPDKRQELLTLLRRQVLAKLAVANPRLAGERAG